MAGCSIDSATIDGFPEAFKVRCDLPSPPADVQSYIQSLDQFVAILGELPVAKLASLDKDDAAAVSAILPLRHEVAKDLRMDAEKFCAGGLNATKALQNVWIMRGRYANAKDRLDRSQFAVSPWPPNAKATDLLVSINAGGAHDEVAPEKQKLYIALENAATVIKACCARLDPSSARTINMLDEFINKLAACGRVGLTGTHPGLAQDALTTVKAEFFARNAGVIKQRANDALIKWAFGGAMVLALPYFLLRWWDQLVTDKAQRVGLHTSFFYMRKEFFLLAAGAAIGTWLSFSIRNLDLAFDDLGRFEDEFLGPWVRIIFVVTLAAIVGLLFWSGAFSISIGNMKILPSISGATALLVGLFSGLSERALASAVSSRAAVFIRGVAGTGSN